VLLLTREEFQQLFVTFQHTAFRLEVRDFYNVATEQEDFRRWLAGEPLDKETEAAARRPWLDKMLAATKEGKRVERVRVVTEPPSPYIRFEMDGTDLNIAAGEDIRYLPRRHPIAANLPDHDFWLFDSRHLVVMNFDDQSRPLPYELVADPATVVQHCYWRDAAWHHAIPHEMYKPL
jgi:hypothetical protein